MNERNFKFMNNGSGVLIFHGYCRLKIEFSLFANQQMSQMTKSTNEVILLFASIKGMNDFIFDVI